MASCSIALRQIVEENSTYPPSKKASEITLDLGFDYSFGKWMSPLKWCQLIQSTITLPAIQNKSKKVFILFLKDIRLSL